MPYTELCTLQRQVLYRAYHGFLQGFDAGCKGLWQGPKGLWQGPTVLQSRD